jgi:hypothetical protein
VNPSGTTGCEVLGSLRGMGSVPRRVGMVKER